MARFKKNTKGQNTPFRQEEIDYINKNHNRMPVTEMAKTLHRGYKTIYEYMEEKNLPIFRLRPAYHGKNKEATKESDFFNVDARDWLI